MNYLKAIKAFYMRVNGDGRTVAAMDVSAPGIGEIIGGSQREERLEILDPLWPSAASIRSTTPDTATSGATARCHCLLPNPPPLAGEGGVGGFERTLAYVTGLANVRDAIPF